VEKLRLPFFPARGGKKPPRHKKLLARPDFHKIRIDRERELSERIVYMSFE
jgi:hypothetical protein